MKLNIGLAIRRVLGKYLWWALVPFLLIMIPLYLIADDKEIKIIVTLNIALFLAVYGYTRVRRFHPIFNKDYLTQLAMSPWHVGQALPRGPVHLIWADAVILTFFALLILLLPGCHWTVPLIAFSVGHIIGLCNSFCRTDQVGFVFLHALFAPLAIYPHFNVTIAFVVLIILIAIGYYGVYCFFKEFPWNTHWWNENQLKTLKQHAYRRRVIQWPFQFLCVEETFSITFTASAIITLIAFWWFHAIYWIGIKLEIYSFGSYLYYVAIPSLIVYRFFIYFYKGLPPISLLGRFRTGRLIIPSYDKIFIAPIAMLLTMIFAPMMLKMLGLPKYIAFELTCSVVLFWGFVLPPSLEQMQYATQSRLIKPFGKPQRTFKRNMQIPAILNRIIKSP